MRWTDGTESCVGGHHGTSLVLWCLLGSEGWDGQVGQRVALGGTMGHPLMFHGVPWGLRDGMERWDREFWWGTPWDIPCSVVSLRNWGMEWAGGTRSFAEEICVDSINEAKKQADMKSTIQWNEPLREAIDWDMNDEPNSLDLVWRSSALFGGPPYTGGLGQTALLPPPPVSSTEDNWNRGLCSGTQYDVHWCPIYPLEIEEWDGKVQKWQVPYTRAVTTLSEFANSVAIDCLFTSQKRMPQIPDGQSMTMLDMSKRQFLHWHGRNWMVKMVVIFHQIRSLHGEDIA